VCWGDLAENTQSLKKGTRVIVTGRLRQRSWETENGDKRSVVEVQADEIGPSLRWARAEVHRNERKAPGESGPSRESAAVGASSAGGTGGYDELGEEPF
jgi:single-strand DNA-binding protein